MKDIQTEESPFVSVIMPYYKTPLKWTKEALDSLVSQTYPHSSMELIVVDDHSSNHPLRPLQKLVNDIARYIPATVIHLKEHKGVAEARNIGIEASKGEFFLTLDSDDTIHEEAVRALVQNSNGMDLVFCDNQRMNPELSRVISTSDKSFAFELYNMYKGTLFDPLLHMSFLSPLNLYRKEVVVQVLGFDPSMMFAEDHDLQDRISLQTEQLRFAYVPQTQLNYRIHQLGNCHREGALIGAQEAVKKAAKRRGYSIDSVVTYPRKIAPSNNTFHDVVINGKIITMPYVDYENFSIRALEAMVP